MESNHTHHPNSKLFAWAIGFAIVIVTNLLFNYAIASVYHEPAYNDFCPVVEITNIPTDSLKPASYNNQQTVVCQKNFDSAHGVYDRNVFIILVVLAIISIVVGSLLKSEILGAGFSWAGVLALVIASGRYWSDAGNLLKVLILVIALGLLIWISIKKFQKP